MLTAWTRQEYEADTTRIRSSNLKLMVKTPQGPAAFARARKARLALDELSVDERRKQDGAHRNLVLGQVFHEWVLEKSKMFYVAKYRRNTAAWNDEADDHPGQTPVTESESKLLHSWHDSVSGNKLARTLLERGFPEQTVLWDEEIDGQTIPCKCRIDWLTYTAQIVDLKTTVSEDRHSFQEQIHKFGYDFSAAFYARGLKSMPDFATSDIQFYHMAVCKNGWAYVWPLGRQWMNLGVMMVERALKDLANCMTREANGMADEDAWPDRQAGTQLTEVPPHQWYTAQASQLAARPLEMDE